MRDRGDFTIRGSKIKIEGDDPACGLFMVDVENPSNALRIRIITQNEPATIRGTIPETGAIGDCRIEVRTQYCGSGSNTLKSPRIITSPFILERA